MTRGDALFTGVCSLQEIYSLKRRSRSDVSVADTKLGFASLSTDAHIGVSCEYISCSYSQERGCEAVTIYNDILILIILISVYKPKF